MALTFSEKFSNKQGDRKFKIYEVTHDGSTATIDASDVGLYRIDYAIGQGKFALSGVADYDYLSDTSGLYITFANALTATTVAVVQIWGY